jgi:hypothetical protein
MAVYSKNYVKYIHYVGKIREVLNVKPSSVCIYI